MKFKIRHGVGIILGLVILVLDFYLFFSPMNRWFKPLILVGLLIISSQFLIDFFNELKRQKEIELKFLEFVRKLVESVRTGVSVPQAIVQIKREDFGALNPYVRKLANQIEWGIPLREGFMNFSKETGSSVIKRAISIVIEAERSGGNIEDVLQSVTDSVLQIKKLKDERKANVYMQTVQGYVVYFIFIGIMLILQIKFIPSLTQLSGIMLQGFNSMESSVNGNLNNVFLSLILIQGFFTGVITGKFAEGSFKNGIKHSLILMSLAYILITTIRGF